MKTLILLVLCVIGASLASGCANKEKQKSSWRIIEEGDDNPMITYEPVNAGERVRRDGDRRR